MAGALDRGLVFPLNDAQSAAEQMPQVVLERTAARVTGCASALFALVFFVPAPVRSAELGACRLLESKEVASAQGEAPKEFKPSERAEGPLKVQDCVFVLPTYAKSISLQVTRGPARDIRERWRAMFRAPRQKDASAEKDEKERKLEPQAVRGVGDESFWLDEAPSGALYVLRRNAILRISVGGPTPRAAKLKRSTELARKALHRL